MNRYVRMLVALVAIAAVLAMAGCGAIAKKGVESVTGVKVDESGNGVTVTGPDGTKITTGEDGQLPDGLPSDVPIYQPSSVTAGMVADTDGGKVFNVGLRTTDAALDVYSWYETELAAQGWSVNTTMKTDDGGLINGEKGTQALTVAISKGSADEGTQVSLALNPKR